MHYFIQFLCVSLINYIWITGSGGRWFPYGDHRSLHRSLRCRLSSRRPRYRSMHENVRNWQLDLRLKSIFQEKIEEGRGAIAWAQCVCEIGRSRCETIAAGETEHLLIILDFGFRERYLRYCKNDTSRWMKFECIFSANFKSKTSFAANSLLKRQWSQYSDSCSSS